MRMILADDETIITEGIQRLIDWNKLGIEVVGVYEDGKSAFEGIIQLKPDLALLDIAMPEMSGIDILRECNLMGVKTRIIFISGFQDFEYAKNAVKYGAVDYLLKPVIREELLTAVERAAAIERSVEKENTAVSDNGSEADFGQLIQLEDTNYVPVLAQIFYQNEVEVSTKRLIQFSFISFLEEYLRENKVGITFLKQEHIVIVLKVNDISDARTALMKIWENAKEATGQQFLFVMGRCVDQMSQIGPAFDECLSMKGYLFFTDRIMVPILGIHETVFKEVERERFEKVKDDLVSSIMKKDDAAFDAMYQQFEKLVCRTANGKKEDACFYFCSTIRKVEERIEVLGGSKYGMEMQELLRIGRSMESYSELVEAYRSILLDYMNGIQQLAENSEKKNFLQAKEYIEKHYQEDLTLNILAEQVHMNPFYFSAFFKKNAGENFKAYVSKIRLEHAITLLVSTNKKTYEIAIEVGFTDARTFTETFQKYYHETPNSYRKKIREK